VSPLSPRRLVVLGYHAIADHREDAVLGKWSVTPERFAAQLEALAGGGWSFVDLDAVVAALAGERDLPRRAVLITFDDAYADLLDNACPALAEHGAPAVVFVVAGKVGATNSWDHEQGTKTVDLLDAEGLRSVAAAGVEVGSHTMGHRPLGRVPAAELVAELVDSAARIEALGLPRPRSFAYPYGDCSPALAAAVADAGYSLAFTINPGRIVAAPPEERFLLPRVVVVGSDTPRDLKLKLASAAWHPRLRRATLSRLGVEEA
jgi:peptidoglycan/xylan/chitin deacetylase (PgdA/CDA1 family)